MLESERDARSLVFTSTTAVFPSHPTQEPVVTVRADTTGIERALRDIERLLANPPRGESAEAWIAFFCGALLGAGVVLMVLL